MANLNPTSFSQLAALASKQHNLMTHKQAIKAGLNRMKLSRLVQTGVWQMVRPRVFRRTAASQTEGQTLMAVCLWLGERTVVSHRSAARWLGLDVVQGVPEVTTPPRKRCRNESLAVHRSRLPPKDIKEHRGLPVTNGARTIIDLAGCLDEDDLAILVEEAWRRQIATPAWVAKRLGELKAKGRRIGALAEILSDARQRKAPLESALEVRVWRLLKRSKLPRLPIPAYEFRDDYGQPGRVDFAFPDHHLALECDGFEHHGGREAFENDRIRTARLVALGWRVMPLTRRQIDDQPVNVVKRIREALEFRSESFPA